MLTKRASQSEWTLLVHDPLSTRFIMLQPCWRLIDEVYLHVSSCCVVFCKSDKYLYVYYGKIKVLLITFKIIHGLCPAYLSSLLQQYHPQRSLRSSSKLLFTVPTVNSVTNGELAFSFSAPILWNSLPDCVRNTTSLSSFESALKTFLFRKFYF